jgi:NAD(P)-dependent dehydrogenase (short-subunit alcohol dehydrogenase family)
MSLEKVALILGSGPNVGRHLSRAFAAKGYKVALASRSFKKEDNETGLTHFQADLSEPESVPQLFAEVQQDLGAPSVVVYNGQYNGIGTQFRKTIDHLDSWRIHSTRCAGPLLDTA